MTLTDEGRRLVDDARAGYGPTASDRERVLSALAARVAAAAASSGGSAAASLSGVAAAKGTIAVVVVAVAVAALGAVSVGIRRSTGNAGVTPPPATQPAVHDQTRPPAPSAGEPAPTAAPADGARERPHRARAETARGEAPFPPRALRAAARSPAPLAPAPPAPAPRPAVEIEPRPEAAADPRPEVAAEPRPDLAAASRADVGPEPRPDVAGEVALLARAQKALAEGDLRRCLRLLDRHEAAFPHGMLAEERAAARSSPMRARPCRDGREALGAFLSGAVLALGRASQTRLRRRMARATRPPVRTACENLGAPATQGT